MSERRYAMKKKSGKVLIIRNQNFHTCRDQSSEERDRRDKETRGAPHSVSERIEKEDADIKELVHKFTELGFTDIYGGTDKFEQKDKSKKEMIELLKQAAQKDFTDDYCFICVILSFGKDGVIICKDDSRDGNSSIRNPTPSMMLPVSELQECLKGDKCQGLLMKPKIFLLQLEPVPRDTKDDTHRRKEEPTKLLKIPREADFLIYNCETDFGIKAWIQGLNEHVVGKKEPLEIQRLLTRMNNIVRKHYEDLGLSSVELPCVTSLLTKEVYLGEKNQQ
ncbi:caspase-7-like [Saccostrea echinata]|uniref:caspase-7-like n=1 Tax=Saccostrea echinata TaxID=191078 RepID=UPI002A7F8049|nr:caspase-7-like [Saccostrea echinata]